MSRPELYISIDVETDGPAPGVNSMLSLGAATFDQEGNEGPGVFYEKLLPLSYAEANYDTMAWWDTQPEAREEVLKDRKLPGLVMEQFVHWLDLMSNYKLIAVGWPIAFDFAFVNYYCWNFCGRNPLGFAGIDIRSYINGILSQPSYYGLGEAELRKLAGDIDKTGLRPHFAVDDAIEQGRLFMAVRRYVINTHKLDEHFNG